MANEHVKGSATTYAGYRYQTLRGVHVLVEWLQSPSRYVRVKFECEDRAVGPLGLDDIVAERADGKFDYWQVKYTPPEAAGDYLLDWAWLIDPGKSSRSLLQKWSDALRSISPGLLGEALLITSRRPDREIEGCLRGDHLVYDLASADVRLRLDRQLGSAAEARDFLATLKIRHSERSYNNLEIEVRSRLRDLAYHDVGVDRLLAQAPNWASFKNSPPPDGWITLHGLRDLLVAARPAPIPQDFEVPQGYEVPDQLFHESTLATVRAGVNRTVTLVGPPGRGKSTYLSFLCQQLAIEGLPLVRHHYFLSLLDKTADRLSPRSVAQSLLDQVRREHGYVNAPTDSPDRLADALATCGAHYAGEGKPFLVVIDGLDHVWRDNYGDKRPLDDLFRQLLPLPPNVVLLVGTQPVDDEKLPARLLSACPRDAWIELPRMTGDAVVGYVQLQVKSQRWQVREGATAEELVKPAEALFELTRGHPLHLIYSVEALLSHTTQPSTYDIEKLPRCPGDDIRLYYGELWRSLSHQQRDVLHLMCELPLRWPRAAFSAMSDFTGARRLVLTGIAHLLYEVEHRLSPFHESLVVFVKEQADHLTQAKALLPQAAQWLESMAEPVLRNSWLWSVQATLGQSLPLRSGLTRDWVLDRLTEGYPVQTFVRMLTDAETIAFAEGRYAETYRHRNLKTRLFNGPQFQLDDFPSLQQAAWAMTQDASSVHDAWLSRQELDTSQLPALALALRHRNLDQQANALAEYARQRWNSELRFSANSHRQEKTTSAARLGRAIGYCRALNVDREVEEERFDNRPVQMAFAVGLGLLEGRDLQALLSIREVTRSPVRAEFLETAAVRLAAANGGDLAAWSESKVFGRSSLAAVYLALASKPVDSLPARPLHFSFTRSADWETQKRQFRSLVSEWFMKTMVLCVYADGPFSWLEAPVFAERENLTDYLRHLHEFAVRTAAALKRGEEVPFQAIFHHFAALEVPISRDYHRGEVYRDFRTSLLEVAIDIHLLSTTVNGPKRIELDALVEARRSRWYAETRLPHILVGLRVPVLSGNAARDVLARERPRLLSELQETCTIAQDLLQLCHLAILHEESTEARRLCRLSWELTIGYGHRKDGGLDSVLSALSYLVDSDESTTRCLLQRLAAPIANVLEYTDGKGTRHVPGLAAKLLAKVDRAALVRMYEDCIEQGDWWIAESCVKHFIATAGESTALRALARTGLSEDERGSATDPGPVQATIARLAESFVGVPPTLSNDGDEPARDSVSRAGRSFVGSPADFPPSRFPQLLDALKAAEVHGHGFLLVWYDYWEKKGKGSTLLRQVGPTALAADRYASEAHYLLDRLFATSLQLNGATDATFEFAVRSQAVHYGWAEHFESAEDSERRLRAVAANFPSRGDEFIARSTTNWLVGRDNPNSIVVPSEKLVFFLVLLGRVAEATDLCGEMVDGIVAETAALDLRKPKWA